MKAEVRAPAKINLTLHVTGQRADGYHLLDSLVVFAPVYDSLSLTDEANALSMTVDGPEAAGVPSDMSNLVLRAADLLTDRLAVTLTKNLPPASGIGGGSADAAAVLRALLGVELTDDKKRVAADVVANLHRLGADVPMCMINAPMRVRGIGEDIEVLDKLPPVTAILINPRRPVATPQVFKAITQKNNPPMPETLPDLPDAAALIAFLREMRNDMQPAAVAIEPAIGEVLSVLEDLPGCGLARMSGSGATCFGLFESATPQEASDLCVAIQKAHPDWWIAAGVLGSQAAFGMPRYS